MWTASRYVEASALIPSTPPSPTHVRPSLQPAGSPASKPSQQFLEIAREQRDIYNEEIRRLIRVYGIDSEAELVTGRISAFSEQLVAQSPVGDVADGVRCCVRALLHRSRRAFERQVEITRQPEDGAAQGSLEAGPEPRAPAIPAEWRLAYAWYHVSYAEPELAHRMQHHVPLKSFAWLTVRPELLALWQHSS